ncbi:hypothetical protein MY04_0661 [Flammeovirga sp. MY04]|uniref:HNH endonuclease domain-containing protein n=1 Tax=Flammeovirga sp. MY04 TaxID=1191459 RepID=UPI0008060D16|nr:HNH endonuclease domain-containing protein [Flammeovirga sp. MY04]ANQ48043.1 hypothetical protein MY04_0661 [Flammeovirga sp. MY04]
MKNRFQNTFTKVTNSYKFYWCLSLINCSNEFYNGKIKFEDLAIEIICLVWYPINYFRLNFGKTDQYEKIILEIKQIYGLADDIKEKDLKAFLKSRSNDNEMKEFIHLICTYVPYRFLSPWFDFRGVKDHHRHKHILENQYRATDLPYTIDIVNKEITLSESFKNWITTDRVFIENYTLFHLLQYLQQRNPNVPGIINKLFKPQTRNLTTQTKIWKEFIIDYPTKKTIFSNVELSLIHDLSVDHYLPWSFVTHDQIWNLHPIEKSVNSAKNNILPSDGYNIPFISMQYDLTRFLLHKKKQNKVLEDYYTVFSLSQEDLLNIDLDNFISIYKKVYNPLFEIAMNMGFQKDWRYIKK